MIGFFREVWLCVCFLWGGLAYSSELEMPYTPSRAEWLNYSISQEVHKISDAWSKRAAIIVTVIPSQNEVIISITFANGEYEPTQAAKVRYIESVRGMAKSVLNRYAWGKDVKLSVQFV
jgi:hypothetical protein